MKSKFNLLTMLAFFILSAAIAQSSDEVPVKSIELRNYTLKSGMRTQFSSYMDRIIIPRQGELGGYLLNAFSLKGADDNYFWIRGFADMQSRSKFMKDFYYSDYWRKHAAECNSMLLDSYDVHLLKPLQIKNQSIDTISGINIGALKKTTGMTVVTYYTTSHQREKLLALFARDYLSILNKAGIIPITFLISESAVNDYLPQHVYQDKNLLVMITHYKDEQEYAAQWKIVNALTQESLKRVLETMLVSSDSEVLYPLKH